MKKYWLKFRSLSLPLQWFSYFLVCILIMAIVFAPENKPVNYQEVSFKTSADSRLYFNNIRSYFYNRDIRSKAPASIYSLKRRIPERDSLGLNFDIVHYPGAEEAYIFASAGRAFEQYDSLYVLFDKYPEGEILTGIRSEGHFRIAAKTYSSILGNQAVYLASSQDTIIQLFTSKASLLDAEITLEDYFKLTLKN